eukprot:CAMPEP_0182858628 /NCGR_PEP_ID=MMETSP0034_2-20130328/3788_1 /TAXON_ID=156128 /ORGANISM="Nephroselmis pyriformis, Strain CCMP717" /LENGTH=316 /DNA_ID=CAMNT_0024990077 /DNA_START=991 /DNA_END=1942 /DNA_ORIENTATION=+
MDPTINATASVSSSTIPAMRLAKKMAVIWAFSWKKLPLERLFPGSTRIAGFSTHTLQFVPCSSLFPLSLVARNRAGNPCSFNGRPADAMFLSRSHPPSSSVPPGPTLASANRQCLPRCLSTLGPKHIAFVAGTSFPLHQLFEAPWSIKALYMLYPKNVLQYRFGAHRPTMSLGRLPPVRKRDRGGGPSTPPSCARSRKVWRQQVQLAPPPPPLLLAQDWKQAWRLRSPSSLPLEEFHVASVAYAGSHMDGTVRVGSARATPGRVGSARATPGRVGSARATPGRHDWPQSALAGVNALDVKALTRGGVWGPRGHEGG